MKFVRSYNLWVIKKLLLAGVFVQALSGIYASTAQLNKTNELSYTNSAPKEYEGWRRLVYPVQNVSSLVVRIPPDEAVEIILEVTDAYVDNFLVFQAHADLPLILSYTQDLHGGFYANDTNPGLVFAVEYSHNNSVVHPRAFVRNVHANALSALILVRNYTNKAPVPGNHDHFEEAKPFVKIDVNLLMTTITIPACKGITTTTNNSTSTLYPLYNIYLTYMYEGDLSEQLFWKTVIDTSNVTTLPLFTQKIDSFRPSSNVSEFTRRLVSYTGVGAVVTVQVSYNQSFPSLYTSTVFYGCDFYPESHYMCTKLVTPFAGLVCASMMILGPILAMAGHRWLNFTMFFSGCFFSWLILFVTFVQVPHANLHVLGIVILLASMLCGIGWVVIWHKVHRPFFSALLIILLCSLFVGMTSTFFLRYALVPTSEHMLVFVSFPLVFSVSIIAYSIKDIKKVHIFACCLLGSYCTMVPPTFYTGSSLIYIVINFVSALSVTHFNDVIGYPPFQHCDIAMLTMWATVFVLTMGHQLIKERASPPFHPPNREVWDSFKEKLSVLQQTIHASCSRRSALDNDSVLEQSDASIFQRTTMSLSRFFCWCSSNDNDTGYQSFPPIGPVNTSLFQRISSRCRTITQNLFLRCNQPTPDSTHILTDQQAPPLDHTQEQYNFNKSTLVVRPE